MIIHAKTPSNYLWSPASAHVCMCVHTIYMIPKATTIKQLLHKLNETEEK